MHASLQGLLRNGAVTDFAHKGVSGSTRWPTMNDKPDKREGKNPKQDPRKDPRQDRLKLALRENLKRRKSQARGAAASRRTSEPDDQSPHEPAENRSEQQRETRMGVDPTESRRRQAPRLDVFRVMSRLFRR